MLLLNRNDSMGLMSCSSGKGSHYGTIEQQFPMRAHDEPPAEKDEEEEKAKEVNHTPRNFLVNPPKKGTGYGNYS
jgi:hypothetical protein